jgi:hypothetical protein
MSTEGRLEPARAADSPSVDSSPPAAGSDDSVRRASSDDKKFCEPEAAVEKRLAPPRPRSVPMFGDDLLLPVLETPLSPASIHALLADGGPGCCVLDGLISTDDASRAARAAEGQSAVTVSSNLRSRPRSARGASRPGRRATARLGVPGRSHVVAQLGEWCARGSPADLSVV